MGQNQVKDLRKQLRNVVKEILPELLQSEAVEAIYRLLREELGKRLDAIDERQKEIAGYMVRQSAGLPPVPPPAPKQD